MDIKQYYKQIKTQDETGKVFKRDIFDFEKIWASNIPVYLVISERGAKGKTMGAKDQALKIFLKSKLKTLWMMNVKGQIENEKKQFLVKPKQYFKDYKDVILKGKTCYYQKKENEFIRLLSLSTSEDTKGGRDDYGMVVYDEFNVKIETIANKQISLISSMLGSLSEPLNLDKQTLRKIIIFGNFKSLNSPLLIQLGLTKIEDEITDLKMGNGKIIMRVLCPQYNENDIKQIKEMNKNNWTFHFQEMLGEVEHTFYNQNTADKINNVFPNMERQILNTYKLYVKKDYYDLQLIKYHCKETNKITQGFYICKSKDINKKQIITLSVNDVIEGAKYSLELKTSIRQVLYRNKVFFEALYIRDNIIQRVRQ